MPSGTRPPLSVPLPGGPSYPFDRTRQRQLEEAGTLLLHGCGLAKEGRAYLFLARSGGGKSTLARLSAREALCLSDEHLLLDTRRLRLAAPPCCPAPDFPDGAPLVAAFVLCRTVTIEIRPLEAGGLLSALARELYPSTWEPAHARLLLDRLAAVAQRLRAFSLGFSLSTDPAALWSAIPARAAN